MASKIEVKVVHRFKASAQRVYDAWLDPAKVRIWNASALKNMGLSGDITQIEIDPRVGGQFLFADMRDGIEAKHWGEYLELDPPHKIVFTWIVEISEKFDPTKVTVTIQPDGDGCIVTVVHEMDAKWEDYRSQTEDGWKQIMEAIDDSLSS